MLRSGRLMKPLIAAVEGYALAGGTEILQATDIRVAAETATFGLAEVQRALFPVGGSTVRLQRQVPYTKAMEILLTGDRISAEEALRIGLIGRIVPEATGAEDREARSPTGLPATARSRSRPCCARCARPPTCSEEEGLHASSQIGMRVFGTEDAKEGPRAFAEKRDPV
jgi:enoyl-CoA hydratase